MFSVVGDMEFKQNKFLIAEDQIVTANPDINTVSIFLREEYFFGPQNNDKHTFGP